jgi:CheY-like chemotaxis protein
MPILLVADDNRLSRELVRDILECEDCRIVEAGNGREALELMGETAPDLVLLDMEMPVMDGFAALAAIRADARFRATPVVAVTAKAMAWERERVERAGFDAYITKPVNSSELRKRVQALLSRPKGEAQ